MGRGDGAIPQGGRLGRNRLEQQVSEQRGVAPDALAATHRSFRQHEVVGALQAYIYAEPATMFPEKSGGLSMYAKEGWRRYFSLAGPLAYVCR